LTTTTQYKLHYQLTGSLYPKPETRTRYLVADTDEEAIKLTHAFPKKSWTRDTKVKIIKLEKVVVTTSYESTFIPFTQLNS